MSLEKLSAEEKRFLDLMKESITMQGTSPKTQRCAARLLYASCEKYKGDNKDVSEYAGISDMHGNLLQEMPVDF